MCQPDKHGLISNLPEGVYKRTVGDWTIELASANLQAKLTFNGWPAGIIDPMGGIIAAGAAANEDTFIAAIEADLGRGIEAFMAHPSHDGQGEGA